MAKLPTAVWLEGLIQTESKAVTVVETAVVSTSKFEVWLVKFPPVMVALTFMLKFPAAGGDQFAVK